MTTSPDLNSTEQDAAMLLLATVRTYAEHLKGNPLPYGTVGHLVTVEVVRDADGALKPDALLFKFSNADIVASLCDVRRLPNQDPSRF
jgi:hypothetical protein